MEDGAEKAGKAGKKTGSNNAEGLGSTTGENEKTASVVRRNVLKELGIGTDESNKHGKSKGEEGKGDSHKKGLDSTVGAKTTSVSGLSTSVTELLARTSDGGGGRKAGSDFAGGLGSQTRAASNSGEGVATRGRSGLSKVSTYGIGQNFTSGFSGGIGSISVWDTAWSIGKSALSGEIDGHKHSFA